MENKKFCVNAYMNLSVKPTGKVSPCCMSEYFYNSDKGCKTLNEDSILNFWNSKSREKFINDLDNGVQVPECNFCWQEELAGKESKRIRDNREFAQAELNKDMLPMVLDLSMGNLCNIKCRICGPKHSTPWAAEEKKIAKQDNKFKFSSFFPTKDKSSVVKESFSYENDYFWKDITKLLPNVVKYDFAGGEPFYIEKHWDIVKAAVDNGWSKNQHVHYNTNGTIFPEKYIHLLEEFKIVDIQISSDGVGKKFEYMRHPAKWDKCEDTISKLVEVKDKSKTEWLLGACISVSAFNVYDIFETFEHYAEKGLRIYINMVHDHRGTRILPTELKKQIISKLRTCESKFNPRQWEKEKNMICKHLENTDYSRYDWKEFCKEIKMRDAFRKESFQDTFPEYAELIKQTGYDYYVER